MRTATVAAFLVVSVIASAPGVAAAPGSRAADAAGKPRHAGAAGPGSSTAPAVAAAAVESEPAPIRIPAAAPLFELHSNFWINLHHVLYDAARATARREEKRAGEKGPSAGSKAGAASAPEAAAGASGDDPAWTAAIAFYRENYARRDLLFDEELASIKRHLALRDADDDPADSDIPKDLAQVLKAAAPIYRARDWPDHDRRNRRWIDEVTPRVERFGPGLASRLAVTLAGAWPKEPIRVDVSFVANWAGAYTSIEPAHIVVASGEPGQQGDVALELLFHESGHAVAGDLRDVLARAGSKAGRQVPRDMWHAILFYTVGEEVRRALLAGGVTDYVPMVTDMWRRGWGDLRVPIETHWTPWLDGTVTFDEAVAAVVKALPPSSEAPPR